jgi:hypothetical protein
MKRVIAIAALGAALTGCTLDEIETWLAWRTVDPVGAHGYAMLPEVQENLRADWDHDGIVEPDPTLPPPPPPTTKSASTASSSASTNGRCTGYEGLLSQYSPGWDVTRMSQIMYRESRCNPGVSNSCCHGLLQMHEMHVGWLDAVDSVSDYYDPARNIAAAAQLWRSSGYGAWSTS